MTDAQTPPASSILRELLIALLDEAAEIEQQLMVQYLYAAFSLKKYPDRTCNEAQYEFVRRWGSTLLMVARQEMEHLALVNGMLSAIGAQPYFERRNIPLQLEYLRGRNLAAGRDGVRGGRGTDPCDIPFVFERFGLPTIQRFVCAESPSLKTLEEADMPIPEWCFACDDERFQGTREGRRRPPALHPVAGSRVPDELWERARAELAPALQQSPQLLRSAVTNDLKPGTIQELYDLVEWLLEFLDARENLFTGDPNNQVFVVVEYQINIFPIVDLASAKQALRLIVEEGEGIDSPPDFQSHFLRFFKVHDELQALLAEDPGFDPSLPLLLNPRPEEITDPFAREVFELFNYTYATLVFMLTSLYRNYQPEAAQSYPFLSSALQESVFGPMMTMLIRPLAEIMAYTKCGDGVHTTGPDYHLSAADQELLRNPAAKEFGDIEFFLGRMDEIVARLDRLTSGLDERLRQAAREESDAPFLDRQLRFVFQSATVLANNLRRIYQSGQIPQFVVTP